MVRQTLHPGNPCRLHRLLWHPTSCCQPQPDTRRPCTTDTTHSHLPDLLLARAGMPALRTAPTVRAITKTSLRTKTSPTAAAAACSCPLLCPPGTRRVAQARLVGQTQPSMPPLFQNRASVARHVDLRWGLRSDPNQNRCRVSQPKSVPGIPTKIGAGYPNQNIEPPLYDLYFSRAWQHGACPRHGRSAC